jgi:integral membrane protein (TIGR01906 family)
MEGKYLQVFSIILVPLVLTLGTTLFLGTSQSFYDSQINSENIDLKFVDLYQANQISEETLKYLKEKDYELNSSLVGVTAKEHMKDVKNLNSIAAYSFFILLLLLAISFLTLAIVHKPKRISISLAYGSILTISLNLILLIISKLSFDSFWLKLHSLVFTNNLWQLNPSTDKLVAVFTHKFFTNIIIAIISITTIISILILVIVILINSKKKVPKKQLNAEFAW